MMFSAETEKEVWFATQMWLTAPRAVTRRRQKCRSSEEKRLRAQESVYKGVTGRHWSALFLELLFGNIN